MKLMYCRINFLCMTMKLSQILKPRWSSHGVVVYLFELPHDKTNKMTVHLANIPINLGSSPVWSESSLCAQWVAKDQSFPHADSEDSDQTGRMPKLIWVFAGRTVILLVLSQGGSFFT